MHARVIATIFRKLTKAGKDASVKSIGAHWDAIGFQGTDPSTDLNRFGGIVNLMHLLHFVSTNFDIVDKICRLSHDSYQSFPFAV